MHRQFLRTSISTASERQWCQCWVKEVKHRFSAHWAKIKIHSWDINSAENEKSFIIHQTYKHFVVILESCSIESTRSSISTSVKLWGFVYLKLQELCEIYAWKEPPFVSKFKKKKIRDNENCIKNRSQFWNDHVLY